MGRPVARVVGESQDTGSTRQYAVRGRKRARTPYRVREQKRRLPVVVALGVVVVVVAAMVVVAMVVVVVILYISV